MYNNQNQIEYTDVSFVDDQNNQEIEDECTMIYNQDTGNVIILDSNNEELPSIGVEENEHINDMLGTDHDIEPKYFYEESENYVSPEKRPRILNNLTLSSTSSPEIIVSDKESQTELTMKQIALMEAQIELSKGSENISNRKTRSSRVLNDREV